MQHFTGPLLSEDSYHPFGGTMAALSSKAFGKPATRYKYNAGTELNDDLELNYYETFFRNYDAQIGRFTGVDIMADSYYSLTPYQFANNNPIFYNDPNGDQYGYMDFNGNKWHGQDPLAGTAGAGISYQPGFGFDGFGDKSSDDQGGGGGNNDGITFYGTSAQNMFGALQNAYNNRDADDNWKFTVGKNKQGLNGFWATSVEVGHFNEDNVFEYITAVSKFFVADELKTGSGPFGKALVFTDYHFNGGLGTLGMAVEGYNKISNDIKRAYAYKLSKISVLKSGQIFQGAKSFANRAGKFVRNLGAVGTLLSVGVQAYEYGSGTWDAHTILNTGLLITTGVATFFAAPAVLTGIAIYGVADYFFNLGDKLDNTIGRKSGIWGL